MSIKIESKEYGRLLEALDYCLVALDFHFVKPAKGAHKDFFSWEKSLSETLRTTVLFSLSEAMEPDRWSVDPIVLVESSYVADKYKEIGLFRGGTSSVIIPSHMQVLQIRPAHVRWQENFEIKYSILNANENSLNEFQNVFNDAMKNYALPILDKLKSPLALANFQLQAKSIMSTRLPHPQPRYRVIGEYISTALLMIESGNSDLALIFLHEVVDKKSEIEKEVNHIYFDQLFWQIEKLMEFYFNK